MLQRLRHAVGWGLPVAPQGTRVDFQVCAQLGHGQTLYLVGDIPLLGGSVDVLPNPSNSSGSETGLALVTTPELYPIWYNLEPLLIPAGTAIHYRYAVCSGSRFLRFENIDVYARELVVGNGSMQTQDTLDSLLSDTSEDSDGLERPWGIVPRLSSGQAFVDRRANASDVDGHALTWPAKRSTSSQKRMSRSMADSIPEESADVTMVDADEDADESAPQVAPPTSLSSFGRRSFSSAGLASMDTGSLSMEDRGGTLSPSVAARGRSYSEESIKSPQNVTIESTDGVIIVVYRLPVLVQRSPEGVYHIEWEDDNLVCPSGLLKESHSDSSWNHSSSSMRLTWIGTVHCSSDIPKEDEERLARQLEEFHCVPVFLNPQLASTYHGFCYGTLWPIFHNIVDVYGKLPTRWWNPNHQKNAWSSYKNVNRIFVNKVIEVYNEGDLVWVHGLHLLVAPSFLARRLPGANVGLFLHTPFPSSEIFRTLSVRADLLRGMLSADHIGFHLYEHARHFLTSCRRILGLKYSSQPGGYIGIEYNGRMVMLTISHIGIEPSFMEVVSQSSQVIEDSSMLADKYEADTRKIVVSVDRVERLKGILLKLGAVELFLATNPHLVSKIQIIQYGIVDSSNKSDERKAVQSEIVNIVARINDRFSSAGSEPIVVYLEFENTDLTNRLPLWNIGDILLTTSVRDAVNLYPFEFVYAHELAKKAGVVIVSEFSGSSRVLTGSIGVNPWKRIEIVEALEKALKMSDVERFARHNKDLEYIVNNSRTKWAERILVDLKRTKKYSTEGDHMGYGLGLGFRMLEFNAGFKMLDIETVARAYRSSFHRVILFDYGNTLVQNEKTSANDFSKYITDGGLNPDTSVVQQAESHGTVSRELLSSLARLCADPRNTVFVLSGKERKELEGILGSVRGLGLAAEHGYLYKWGDARNGNVPDTEQVWLCTKDNFDDSWKDITHSVMDIYTQRTHGTYIELKGSALLWQFRDADPEFGQLQAKELHDQLNQVLEHFHVEVIAGTDYLEVRPEGVDKGVIVDRIMSTLESTTGKYVDFIMCVGDDSSDEFMFQYLEEMRARPNLYTVTVGKKPSAAKYFVNDVDQVMELLHSLTKMSTTANRNLSMNDLRLLDRNVPPSDFFGSFRTSGVGLEYQSEGSFEGAHSSPFAGLEGTNGSNPNLSSLASAQPSIGNSMLRTAKHSMSMSALSSAAKSSLPPTSSTYAQYFDNIEEDEEDQGGIFF